MFVHLLQRTCCKSRLGGSQLRSQGLPTSRLRQWRGQNLGTRLGEAASHVFHTSVRGRGCTPWAQGTAIKTERGVLGNLEKDQFAVRGISSFARGLKLVFVKSDPQFFPTNISSQFFSGDHFKWNIPSETKPWLWTHKTQVQRLSTSLIPGSLG